MKIKRNHKIIIPVRSTGILEMKFSTKVHNHPVLRDKFFRKGETFRNLYCTNKFVHGFDEFQLYCLYSENNNINIEQNSVKSEVYKLEQKNIFKKKLFLSSYKKDTEIRTISISLASSQDILRWAERTLPNGKIIGKVTNANTLHYKTFKPQKGGLFCERIFGPVKDFECACGKIQKSHNLLTQPLFLKKGDVGAEHRQNSLTENSKISGPLAFSEQNSTQSFMKSEEFIDEQNLIGTKFKAEKRNSILKNLFFEKEISQTLLNEVQLEQMGGIKTDKNIFQQIQSDSKNLKNFVEVSTMGSAASYPSIYPFDLLDHAKIGGFVDNYKTKNSRLRLFTGFPNAAEKQGLRKYCPNCDVEYTWSISRRYKLGYIQLTLPVTHVWYLKGTTSLLGNLLSLKKKVIISLTYNSETTVLETSQNSSQINNLLRTSSPFSLFKSWTNLISATDKKKFNNLKDENFIALMNEVQLQKSSTENTLHSSGVRMGSALNISNPRKFDDPLLKPKRLKSWRSSKKNISKVDTQKTGDQSYPGLQQSYARASVQFELGPESIDVSSEKNGTIQSYNKLLDIEQKFPIKRLHPRTKSNGGRMDSVHGYSRLPPTLEKMTQPSISFYILYKKILKQKFYAEQSSDQTLVVTFPFQRLGRSPTGVIDTDPTLPHWIVAPVSATTTTTVDANAERLSLQSQKSPWSLFKIGISKKIWKIFYKKALYKALRKVEKMKEQEKNEFSFLSNKLEKNFTTPSNPLSSAGSGAPATLGFDPTVNDRIKKKKKMEKKEDDSDFELQNSVDIYLFRLSKKINFIKKGILAKYYAIGNQTAGQGYFGLWRSDARKSFHFREPGQNLERAGKQGGDMAVLNTGIVGTKFQSSVRTLLVIPKGITGEVIYFEDLEKLSPDVKILFEKLVNLLTAMLNLFFYQYTVVKKTSPPFNLIGLDASVQTVEPPEAHWTSIENFIPIELLVASKDATTTLFLKKLLYLERSLVASKDAIGYNLTRMAGDSKDTNYFWTLYNTKSQLATNCSKSFSYHKVIRRFQNNPVQNDVDQRANSLGIKVRNHIFVRGSRGLRGKVVTSQNSQKFREKAKMNLQTSLHMLQNIAKKKLDLTFQTRIFARSPLILCTTGISYVRNAIRQNIHHKTQTLHHSQTQLEVEQSSQVSIGERADFAQSNHNYSPKIFSTSSFNRELSNSGQLLNNRSTHDLFHAVGARQEDYPSDFFVCCHGLEHNYRRSSIETKFRNKFYQFSFIHRWYDSYSFQSILMYISSPVNFDDKIIKQYSSTSSFYDSTELVIMQEHPVLRNDQFLKNSEKLLASKDARTTVNPKKMSVWATSTNFENNAATDPSFSGAGLLQKILFEFNINEVLIQNLIDLKKLPEKIFELEKKIRNYKQLDDIEPVSKVSKKNYEFDHFLFARDNLPSSRNLDYILCEENLKRENHEKNSFSLEEKLKNFRKKLTILKQLKPKLIRRIKLLQLFEKRKTEPESMILKMLPVLPADLRPIMKLGDQIAASDLNRLYQRIIYRNERLKKFLKEPVTRNSEVTRFAHRLLQEAVDNLIENGKSGVKPETDSRGRTLKSLSAILKGKTGRFRQYLLGKRVDYSGRSVIVVGPKLKIHECGIPYDMAIELFLPFLLKRILNYKLVKTVLGAKKFIQTNNQLTKELLREIMTVSPVLLNRAPTLHRLGIQAFQPKLVDGKAIILHPLVCPAFNADFDGDQMAVHVPITVEARAEALKLMFSRNNLLSPATGDPLVLPSQDMVLGCYYLTTEKFTKQKSKQIKSQNYVDFFHSNLYFNSLEDVLKKYNKNIICVEKTGRSINPVLFTKRLDTGIAVVAPFEDGAIETLSLRDKAKAKFFKEAIKKKHNLPANIDLSTSEKRAKLRTQFVFSLQNKEVFSNKQTFPLLPDFALFQQNSTRDTWTLSSQNLHSNIWIKWEKKIETGGEHEPPLEIRLNRFGFRQEIYSKILRNYDKLNNKINQYIKTTPGKILFNLLFEKSTKSSSELLK